MTYPPKRPTKRELEDVLKAVREHGWLARDDEMMWDYCFYCDQSPPTHTRGAPLARLLETWHEPDCLWITIRDVLVQEALIEVDGSGV